MTKRERLLPRVVIDMPVPATVTDLLAGKVELLPWDAFASESHEPVDGVYTYGHPRLDGELLDRMPDVRVISNHGVGVDHINLDDAQARKIPVGNTPGILNGATADLAFALLLAAARRVAEGDRYARSAAYVRSDSSILFGREVHGATLGILGMGGIGAEVARRAKGFAMPVLYHNRQRRGDCEAELGARYVALDELLKASDYLVLTVPLTAETTGLIDAAALAKMKPTATLINVARGAVVDTAALTETLRGARLFAAALDVTDPEPLPRDHPLLAMDNVTLLPHLGSATVQTRQQMVEHSIENLLRGLRGAPLLDRAV